MKKFTKESIFKLQYDPTGPETQQVWGTGEDKNLGISLSPRGDHVWIARVYILQPDKRSKKRIGRLFQRPLTVRDKSLDEARQERDVWKVEAAQGMDPIEKRCPQSSAAPAVGQLGPATVSILLQAFMVEYAEKELEEYTCTRYRTQAAHINKHLGNVPIAQLDKTKLNAFRRAMAEKRETFNKCRTELSNAFKVADRLDWTWAGAPMVPPGFNPVLSVPRYETAAARRAGNPFEPEEIEAIVAAAQQYLRPDYVRTVLNAPSRSTVALPVESRVVPWPSFRFFPWWVEAEAEQSRIRPGGGGIRDCF